MLYQGWFPVTDSETRAKNREQALREIAREKAKQEAERDAELFAHKFAQWLSTPLDHCCCLNRFGDNPFCDVHGAHRTGAEDAG